MALPSNDRVGYYVTVVSAGFGCGTRGFIIQRFEPSRCSNSDRVEIICINRD